MSSATRGPTQEFEEKRMVHPTLKYILEKDVEITKKCVDFAKKFSVTRSLKYHYQMLEISCHGTVWIVLCLISVWALAINSLYQLQMNILLALFIDLVIVALLKAYTRRRRPIASSQFGPDKYSFPSGHASRVTMLVYIFVFIDPVPFIFFGPLFMWFLSVSVSRVMSEKHHILDVVAGIITGLIEGLLMSLIWMGPEVTSYLVNWLTDEKIAGAEYDL